MSLSGIILYTRSGCHLCDEAAELLAREGVLPELVDIDVDPVLRARFTNCVPVLEHAGKVRFRGRISPFLLRRWLAGLRRAAVASTSESRDLDRARR